MAVSGGQVYAELTMDDRQFGAALRRADAQLSSFSGGIQTALSGLAAFAAFRAGTGLARDLIQTGSAIQQFKVQLNAALQDNEKAARRMAEAIEFAMSTPFQSNDAVAAIRDLSLLNFGDIEKGMRGIGNIAMTFGRSMQEVSGAMYQMNSMVLRQFGITVDRMGSVWKVKFRGKVYTPVKNDIDGLRDLIISQIGNIDLAGGIEAGAKTIQGQLSQMGDRFEEVRKSIMETNGVSEYLTRTLQNLVQEFYAVNHSTEGESSAKQWAGEIKKVIDAAAGSARIFGRAMAFAAEHGELLKGVVLSIAAIKIGGMLTAGVTSLASSFAAAQSAGAGMAPAIQSIANGMKGLGNSGLAAAKGLLATAREAGGLRAIAGDAAGGIKALGSSLGGFAKNAGSVNAGAAGTVAVFAVLTAAIEQVTGAWRTQELAMNGAKEYDSRSVVENLNSVENELDKARIKLEDMQDWMKRGFFDALKHPFQSLEAGSPNGLENAKKTVEALEAETSKLKTMAKIEEQIKQSQDDEYLNMMKYSDVIQFRTAAEERLIKLAKERAENEKTANDEASKAFADATKVSFGADLSGDVAEFEKHVRAIQSNMQNALSEARKQAAKSGVDVTALNEAVYQQAADQISKYIKEIEDSGDTARAAYLRLQLPRLASETSLSGLDSVLNYVKDLDMASKKLAQSADLTKYYEIPQDAFVPQLEAYLKKLKPLSKEWKDVRDAIDSAKQAQKDYQDALAGRTEDMLGRLKAAYDKGFISPQEFSDAVKSNMAVIADDISRDLADVFNGTNMTGAQKYAVVMDEVSKRMEGIGAAAVKVGGITKGFTLFGEGDVSRHFSEIGVSMEQASREFGRGAVKVKEFKTEYASLTSLPGGAYRGLILGADDGQSIVRRASQIAAEAVKMLPDKNVMEGLVGGAVQEYKGGFMTLSRDFDAAMLKSRGIAAEAATFIVDASGKPAENMEELLRLSSRLAKGEGGFDSKGAYDSYMKTYQSMMEGLTLKTGYYFKQTAAGLARALDPGIAKMQEAGKSLARQGHDIGYAFSTSADGIARASVLINDRIVSVSGTAAENLKKIAEETGGSMNAIGRALFGDGGEAAKGAASVMDTATGKAVEFGAALAAGTNAAAANMGRAEQKAAGAAKDMKEAAAASSGGTEAGLAEAAGRTKGVIDDMGKALTDATAKAAADFQSISEKISGIAPALQSASELAVAPWREIPPILDDALRRLGEVKMPVPEETGSLANIVPAITSLHDILAQENLTAGELIRANAELRREIEGLKNIIASKEFTTTENNIDMVNHFVTATPAQTIAQQLNTLTAGV